MGAPKRWCAIGSLICCFGRPFLFVFDVVKNEMIVFDRVKKKEQERKRNE
jgi:hypothetical protein